MPKMYTSTRPQVNIRLSETLIQRADKQAVELGLPRIEVLRRAIAVGLTLGEQAVKREVA